MVKGRVGVSCVGSYVETGCTRTLKIYGHRLGTNACLEYQNGGNWYIWFLARSTDRSRRPRFSVFSTSVSQILKIFKFGCSCIMLTTNIMCMPILVVLAQLLLCETLGDACAKTPLISRIFDFVWKLKGTTVPKRETMNRPRAFAMRVLKAKLNFLSRYEAGFSNFCRQKCQIASQSQNYLIFLKKNDILSQISTALCKSFGKLDCYS